MKKISIALIIFMSFLASGFAQTDSTKTHVKRTRQSTVTTSSTTGMKKDGTPDMRLKANRQAKAQASTQTQSNVQTNTQATQSTQATTAPAATQTQSRTQTSTMSSKSNVKSADPSIGTDAKGRTIYQGSRGGKYVMTANGNKEYIKAK